MLFIKEEIVLFLFLHYLDHNESIAMIGHKQCGAPFTHRYLYLGEANVINESPQWWT